MSGRIRLHQLDQIDANYPRRVNRFEIKLGRILDRFSPCHGVVIDAPAYFTQYACMSRKKPAPDLIRGGDRLSEKDMRQSTNLERIPIQPNRNAR
jgi:hypothetical protein